MAFVTLVWDANTDAGVTGYRVHYGTVSGTYTLSLDAGTSTTATANGLSPGSSYYFAVEAYNSGGLESAPSNEVSFSVPGGLVGNVYFGFRTDGQAGGGASAADPIDCTTHAQMDAAMAQYNASGNHLFFAGGTYQWTGAALAAAGAPGTLTLFSDSSWNGATTGADTVFQLVNAATSSCFLSNGGTGWLSNVTIQDITFDCQGNGNPGNASYNAAILCGGADHLTIQRCVFSNFCTFTGANVNVVRVFGGSTSDAANHTMQNVLVDACTFVAPSRGNKGGAYPVTVGFAVGVANSPSTCVVSNCIFDTLDSDFTFLRCIANAPTVKNNYATQCQTLYYFEPQEAHTYPILIDTNRMEACNAGFVLLWDPQSAGGANDGSQNAVASTGPITLRNNTYSRRKLVTGSSALNGLSGAFFRAVNQLAYTSAGAHDTSANYYAGPPSNASLLVEKNWIFDFAYSTTGFPLLGLYDAQATQGIAIKNVVVRNNLFFCAAGMEMELDARKGASGVLRQFQGIGNTTVPADGGDRSVHLNDQLLKLIAVARFGCKVIYIDSWGAANTPPLAYDSTALRVLVTYAKNILGIDVLLLPEAYGRYDVFGAASPWRGAEGHIFSSPPAVRKIWPTAKAAIRWENKGQANSAGPALSMFPPGNNQHNATLWTATIEYMRECYEAGDHIIAHCHSGTPSECQMAANMINLIDQNQL